jgi:hypothetical protein
LVSGSITLPPVMTISKFVSADMAAWPEADFEGSLHPKSKAKKEIQSNEIGFRILIIFAVGKVFPILYFTNSFRPDLS